MEGAECYACWVVKERTRGARARVRAVWDAEVNRGEKVIGIRKFEEAEWRVSFVRRGELGSADSASLPCVLLCQESFNKLQV